MLDFNEPPQQAIEHDKDAIKSALLSQLESVLMNLLPAGKKRGQKFLIGDTQGAAGDSLEVSLNPATLGQWYDHATGEGGDIFSLIAAHDGFDAKRDFSALLERATALCGYVASQPKPTKPTPSVPMDDLGPATGKWDYLDATGKLIACVYRYEPSPGKKEYRPWDAKKRKQAPPNPRPLYNQPGMAQSDMVILVEGEKCAQALIDAGLCATTAMHGANAPVDKTDWSPLKDKTILIWPDKDKPGWEYAQKAGEATLISGATSCAILLPPDDKPEGWDAADAINEGWDVDGFILSGKRLMLDKPAETDSLLIQELMKVNWRSDDGLALAFTRHYGDDWRYIAKWGKWYQWNGRRWQEDNRLYLFNVIRGICRTASQRSDDARTQVRLASSSAIASVEKVIRPDPKHAATVEDWDKDVWKVNTPGGVVDLKTGRLSEHQRHHAMTKITTATPQGDCPLWLNFIDSVTGGDSDMKTYLQRMAGYFLTGSTQEHALFFLYGTGGNGKSVFVNTLFTILGDYAANAPMDTFMEARGDKHPTDLAGLMGARFVAATETEQGRRWNESKIKEISGGDPISARFMRQDFFTYIPQFKLVISGNHKPAIRNVDEAMRRRLHLIPFTITVPANQRDRGLQQKLLFERDGIMAWMLAGCLAWQQHGLVKPPKVLAATDDYFEEEDAMSEFEEIELIKDPQSRTPINAIFTRWKSFSESRGYYTGSARWLTEQLVMRGYSRVKMTGGTRGLNGVKLVPKEDAFLPYADN